MKDRCGLLLSSYPPIVVDVRGLLFCKKQRKIQQAFTLIELLVIVAIIGILVAILMPALSKAKDKAKQVLCMNNMKQLFATAQLYNLDYNGFYPAIQGHSENDNSSRQGISVQLLCYHHKQDSLPYDRKYKGGIFLCPADRYPAHQINNDDIRSLSYNCNMYSYGSAGTYVATKGYIRALLPARIKPKKGGISSVIFFGESWNIDYIYHSAPVVGNPTSFGETWVSNNLMARHNGNKGFNFIYYDGHAWYDNHWHTNATEDLASLTWGYFNY